MNSVLPSLSDAAPSRSGRPLTTSLSPLLWLLPTLVLSLVVAYLLRFDGILRPPIRSQLLIALPWVIPIKTCVFLGARITRSCHAFVSFHDAIRLLKTTVAATAGVAVFDALAVPGDSLPRGVILIDTCLTALLIGGIMTAHRVRRERREKPKVDGNATPVLIAGGPAGVEVILRSIRCGRQEKYRPLGLLTDQDKMLHREIAGIPVLGTLQDAAAIAQQVGASTVLLASSGLPGIQIRGIMAKCEEGGIALRIVPDVSQIVGGEINFRPREVAIEDLLGRSPVDIDQTELQDWLGGRDLMVTGSCGSIGSELVRQLLRFQPRHVTLVDRNENGQFHLGRELSEAIERGQAEIVIADVNDRARMEALFKANRPEVVFHAAAYKHVPLMEQHPGEGVKNIIGATKIVADLSHAYGVQTFVMISTDKAVNPTNAMGCCKRVAELYVQSMSSHSACRFVTVRFGNVLGSAGSVIPVFREQIAAGGPVTVTDPRMTRFFMTIPEASQLVIQAGRMGHGGEIFVLDMGTPVRILDLAEDMIRLSGLQVGHDIEVKICGLRPGEKLYEELYSDEETQSPTHHPKILKANCVRVSHAAISQAVANILASTDQPRVSIYAQLKRVVPSFTHDAISDAQPETGHQNRVRLAA